MKALFSAAAVCVSVEFFLITSQRSPTAVRHREKRARERASQIEVGRRWKGKGWEERRSINGNRKTAVHRKNRASERK